MTKDGSDDDVFGRIAWGVGTAVLGHSMGGQATVFSSSYENATNYDVRAAVMHHAYTHEFPAPQVPFLAFTGVEDLTAPPSMAKGFFLAPNAHARRGYVNRKWTTHHEPDILNYNSLLPQFTAAWLKIYLDQTPQADGNDYHRMIYGNSTDSLCNGGDGSMEACEVY